MNHTEPLSEEAMDAGALGEVALEEVALEEVTLEGCLRSLSNLTLVPLLATEVVERCLELVEVVPPLPPSTRPLLGVLMVHGSHCTPLEGFYRVAKMGH